jgi:hypothetical protein
MTFIHSATTRRASRLGPTRKPLCWTQPKRRHSRVIRGQRMSGSDHLRCKRGRRVESAERL